MKKAFAVIVLGLVLGALLGCPSPDEGDGIDLTGYWDVYILAEGEPEFGPGWLFIQQTDSDLEGQVRGGGRLDGSIDGTNVSLQGDPGGQGNQVSFAGTVEGDCITGTASTNTGHDTFRMCRSTLPFGHLDLTGSYQEEPLALDTEYAIGSKGEPGSSPMSFILEFWDTQLFVYLEFNVVGEDLEAGRDYSLLDEAWGLLGVGRWQSYEQGTWSEIEVALDAPGTLHITSYSADGIAGTYSASFQEGGSITGTFDVSFFEGFH